MGAGMSHPQFSTMGPTLSLAPPVSYIVEGMFRILPSLGHSLVV